MAFNGTPVYATATNPIADITDAPLIINFSKLDDLAVSGVPDHVTTRDGLTRKEYIRKLTVNAVINSNIGNNLPITKKYVFYIEET